MRPYMRLSVWRRSMELVTECYRLSRDFPKEELFCLTSQLRRAAISIATNIAEGNGRVHRNEYLHHLSISQGSLNEVETLLGISQLLGYTTEQKILSAFGLADETGKMLTVMRRRLAKRAT